ncbi:MAG: hypothetical protein WBV37_10205 [Nocardioidaceae bacterium]
MVTTLRMQRGLGAATVASALSAFLLAGSMAPATANPRGHEHHHGGIKDLTLTAAKPDNAYRLHAAWTAASRTKKYVVSMTSLTGTALGKSTVSTPSWTGRTTLPVGSWVKVTVLPSNGKWRRGTSEWIKLPDLTAPVATYTVTPTNSSTGLVTIHLTSLSDDVTPAAGMTQHVNWGGSTSLVSATGLTTSFVHSYGPTKAVHHPVVTVSDAAGNSSSYELTAVVADVIAPTGAFSVSPTSAWAKWTKVTLTQSDLQDDLSPAEAITKVVTWGDGKQQSWKAGSALVHRYKAAGAFTPFVLIADEAGNTADLATSTVTVTTDSVAPSVRLKTAKHAQKSVRRWTTLKGRASDLGTGVRKIRMRAIEKRGNVWYSYRPASHRWVRAGSSRAAAWSKAKVAKVSPGATSAWAFQLHRLKVGVLVYRVSAVDNVKNKSAVKSHRAVLTRS